MPEKYGENKLIDRVRNKEVSQRVKRDGDYPTNNKTKEAKLHWLHVA